MKTKETFAFSETTEDARLVRLLGEIAMIPEDKYLYAFVDEYSPIRELRELEGKIVETKYPEITKNILGKFGVSPRCLIPVTALVPSRLFNCDVYISEFPFDDIVYVQSIENLGIGKDIKREQTAIAKAINVKVPERMSSDAVRKRINPLAFASK